MRRRRSPNTRAWGCPRAASARRRGRGRRRGGAVDAARSPTELRCAHDAYLRAVTTHCLLHPEGRPCASLITSILALVLSLHREVLSEEQAQRGGAADAEGAPDGAGRAGDGATWAALVEASRRQFSLLLVKLSKQPLAPSELLLPSVVLGGAA